MIEITFSSVFAIALSLLTLTIDRANLYSDEVRTLRYQVQVGSSIDLLCVSNATVVIGRFSPAKKTRETRYDHLPFEVLDRNFDLHVFKMKNISKEDEGTYSCYGAGFEPIIHHRVYVTIPCDKKEDSPTTTTFSFGYDSVTTEASVNQQETTQGGGCNQNAAIFSAVFSFICLVMLVYFFLKDKCLIQRQNANYGSGPTNQTDKLLDKGLEEECCSRRGNVCTTKEDTIIAKYGVNSNVHIPDQQWQSSISTDLPRAGLHEYHITDN